MHSMLCAAKAALEMTNLTNSQKRCYANTWSHLWNLSLMQQVWKASCSISHSLQQSKEAWINCEFFLTFAVCTTWNSNDSMNFLGFRIFVLQTTWKGSQKLINWTLLMGWLCMENYNLHLFCLFDYNEPLGPLLIFIYSNIILYKNKEPKKLQIHSWSIIAQVLDSMGFHHGYRTLISW